MQRKVLKSVFLTSQIQGWTRCNGRLHERTETGRRQSWQMLKTEVEENKKEIAWYKAFCEFVLEKNTKLVVRFDWVKAI